MTLVGELDLASAPLVEATLSEAGGDGDVVALDLSALSFIDCAGLRVLLAADARERDRGGRLIIVGSSGPVRRLFDLTGASALLNIAREPSNTSQASDDFADDPVRSARDALWPVLGADDGR